MHYYLRKILFILVLTTVGLFAIGQSSYEKELLSTIKNHSPAKDDFYFEKLYVYTKLRTDQHAEAAPEFIDQLIAESLEEKKWNYWVKGNTLKARFAALTTRKINQDSLFNEILINSHVQQDSSLIALTALGHGQTLLIDYHNKDTVLLKKVQSLLLQAYSILKNTEPKEAVEVLHELIMCHSHKPDPLKALETARDCIPNAHQLGDSSLIGTSYFFLAYCSKRLNYHQEAVDAGLKALQFLNPNKDQTRLASLHMILSNLATRDHNPTSAIEHGEEALRLAKIAKNPIRIAQAHFPLVYSLLNDGHIQRADTLNEQYFSICNQFNFTIEKINYFMMKGWIYEEQDSNQLAMNTYLEGLQLIDSTGVSVNKPWLLHYITELMRKKNIPSNLTIDETLSLFNQYNNENTRPTNNISLCTALKNLYQSNGEYQKALAFSEKLFQYQTNAFNEQAKANLEAQKLRLEKDAQLQKIAFQKKQIQQQSYAQKLLYGLLFSAFLFILIIYYFLNRQKLANSIIKEQNDKLTTNQLKIKSLIDEVKIKNTLLQNQLAFQQKEVVDYIIVLGKRNQKGLSIKKNIEELIAKGNASVLDLKDLKKQHEQLLDKNNEIDFKQRVESLYPGFFEKLTLKHPTLTKGDIRHSAYVLINLSAKQVAELLFISTRTVDSARYRAKQKMGLNNEINLREYLLTIQNLDLQ